MRRRKIRRPSIKTDLPTTMRRLCRDEKAVTLVEYGIALIVAISVGTASLLLLSDAVSDRIEAAERSF